VNGVAVAGDYLSAANFREVCGLIAYWGFDGFLCSIERCRIGRDIHRQMEPRTIRVMRNPRISSGVGILAFMLALATVAPAPAIAVAAPAPPAPSGTKAVSPRVANLAAAIRAEIKSKSGGGGAQLFKAFGIDPGAPASAYLADAEILDGHRSHPPLPAMSEAQQNQALAQVYLKVRMQGKGVGAVGAELDELMKYATGQKPLHELNGQPMAPAKGDCPHGGCALQMRKLGQVMCGSSTYDRFGCPNNHETLLRVP
jgi:hypothetical protein